MKKHILFLIPILALILLIKIAFKDTDKVTTIIEENSTLPLSINYPNTQIKEIDNLVTDYVTKAYNDFKKMYSNINTVYELNIDFDEQTLNDQYYIVSLKKIITNHNQDTTNNDVYTVMYDKHNHKIIDILNFIDNNKLRFLIQTELVKNYRECTDIDTLSQKIPNNNFTVNNEKITFTYQSDKCGVININIPNVIPTNSKDKEKIFPIELGQKEVDIDKPVIAFSFDDGPSKYTKDIIEYFHQNDVYGTFFVIGNKVKSYSPTLKKLLTYGNEIGNHTFNHRWLSKLSDAEIKEQINKTQDIIYNTTGFTPKLLRPSYGIRSKKINRNTNLSIVYWDIDTSDWKSKNAKRIADRILNKDCDGKIVLMHDTYSRALKVLKIIVPELKEKGYQFVTISDLYKIKHMRSLYDDG